ncbi:MAG: HD domain-containing protein [Planctomycetota bacterium]|jgi:hypothetical protein
MEQDKVEEFKHWFETYVAGFYGDDEFINANIELKDKHSMRVCQELRHLTGELDLSENQKRIADVIALFHDIGRFEQFVKYRTYSDSQSVNHCKLGLEILKKTQILKDIDPEERKLIFTAIGLHGRRELPAKLDGDALLFSQLIRDVDKIDIYYVVTSYYKQYQENPDEFKLEVELPDTPEYSPEVVQDILNGKRIDYHDLRTWNDMKLCQLSWVYDINFAATLKRIKEKGYIELIVSYLPQEPDIERVQDKILAYINERIEKEI